jgi:hypothetical protein
VTLGQKKFDLFQILDELTLVGCYDPKNFVSQIRGFLTFCARMTGSLSDSLKELCSDISSSSQHLLAGKVFS